MTTVPELLAGMATVARADLSTTQAPVIAYPPVPRVATSPTIVFSWGRGGVEESTTVTHMDTDRQEWAGEVIGRVLITHEGNSPAEMGRIDALVVELFDVFAQDANGHTAIERHRATFPGVYQLLPTGMRNSLTVTYAGEPCYASDVIFRYRLDRTRSE